MADRVEHDAKTRWVPVRWLVSCFGAAACENTFHRRLKVVHEYFEEHHLRLATGLLRPDWGLGSLMFAAVGRQLQTAICQLHDH